VGKRPPAATNQGGVDRKEPIADGATGKNETDERRREIKKKIWEKRGIARPDKRRAGGIKEKTLQQKKGAYKCRGGGEGDLFREQGLKKKILPAEKKKRRNLGQGGPLCLWWCDRTTGS